MARMASAARWHCRPCLAREGPTAAQHDCARPTSNQSRAAMNRAASAAATGATAGGPLAIGAMQFTASGTEFICAREKQWRPPAARDTAGGQLSEEIPDCSVTIQLEATTPLEANQLSHSKSSNGRFDSWWPLVMPSTGSQPAEDTTQQPRD